MEEKFYYAIQANDVTTLQLLLECGANANTLFTGQKCPFGRHNRWSALHLCCEKGHYDCAKVLLEAGADPNPYDKWNQTPLAYAIQTQWHNLVELLISHGADVNEQDRKGRTPVHFCVEYTDEACIDHKDGLSDCAALILTLMKSGANPNVGDMLERTPLWIAGSEDGHLDQIRTLLQSNECHVDSQDVREKRTALQAAIMHTKKDRLEYVRLLLEAGSDVNKRDARNHTALMNVIWRTWKEDGEYASEEDLEICRLILKADYDINDVSPKRTWIEYGGTALALAVERGATSFIDLFLEHGADPDIVDDSENTPLLLCVRDNKMNCAARLLRYNANINIAGRLKIAGQWENATAFQFACAQGNMDVAMVLVMAGYDLSKETYLWTDDLVPSNLVRNEQFWAWLRADVRNPHCLVDLCKMKLRCILGKRVHNINKLPIPSFLKGLVLLDNILAPWLDP